jgi:phosphatidylserine/phosphatidylglycerophosphate/cardiolipin synthase-like enzyme
MEKKLVLGILIGVVLGIAIGAETIRLADERVCPHPACVREADVIPISDRGYFDAVHKILSQADSSIHIVSFELKYYDNYKESSANTLVEDLIAAHQRGVDVGIIVDEYSKENNAFQRLKDAGVPIKYDSDETTTHAKLIVVDGKIVVLGSTNLSYFGLEKNNEVDVVIKHRKIAEYFEGYFQSMWES